MPRFEVLLQGSVYETWRIEAATADEAEALVRAGKGDYVSTEWAQTPTADVGPVASAA